MSKNTNSVKEQIEGSKRLNALKHHPLHHLNFVESHDKNKRRDFYLNLIEQQPAYIKHLSGDELYTEMPKIKSSKYVSPQQASEDLKGAIIYYEKVTNPLQQTNMNITSHTPKQTGRATTSAPGSGHKTPQQMTKRDIARKKIQESIEHRNATNPYFQHKQLVQKENGAQNKKQQKEIAKMRKKSGSGAISSAAEGSLSSDIYRQTMQQRINNDVTHNSDPARTLKHALHFPANMLPHSELKIFADNNLSPDAIEKNVWMRIIMTVGIFLVMSGAGFALKDFQLLTFSHVVALFVGVGAFLAFLIMYISHNTVLSTAQNLKYTKQASFNEFCEILVPYMTKIKNGDNIIDILSSVAKRTKTQAMRERINSLILRIDNSRKSRQPYVDFADDCSGSVPSEMFMNIVYDMAQGDFDTEGINNMDRDLNNNQIRLIRTVVKKKMKRFKKVETLFLCVTIFFIIAFLLLFIVSIGFRFGKIMHGGAATGI